MTSVLTPFILLLHVLLKVFHTFTADWGAAIILLTLTVRSLLFIVNLNNAKQQLIQTRIAPKLKELRQKYEKDATKLSTETMQLYRASGLKPFSMVISAVVQMPIFFSLYRLFGSHGPSMTSLLLPWLDTLGQTDPYYIVPILCAALQFIGFMIPLTGEHRQQEPVPISKRLILPLIFTAAFSFFLIHAPAALALYWTASAAFALLERAFYRIPFGRKLVTRGVPDLD